MTDETPGSTHPYIKVKGQWNYLYRAVDQEGNTVDYLLTAKRDRKAAKRFLLKAVRSNDEPVKITTDKSGANTSGIETYNEDEGTDIEIRQNRYLNNIIEQDHRPISMLDSPQELRTLMFHELLHAAGYDHPRVECHWRQAGCGVMGHSPYPHLRMNDSDYEALIRFSFNRKYFARLPLIADQSHGTANLQKSH